MAHPPIDDFDFSDIPKSGSAGSFWEDRGDRRHCGIDIYASPGADVYAVNDGIIADAGLFTSPRVNYYWNNTYFIVLKTTDEHLIKYAELQRIFHKKGEEVESGEKIGEVGIVLNPAKIDSNAPEYVQYLIDTNRYSMLHMEVFSGARPLMDDYSGGNYFCHERPRTLVNPVRYLKKLLK
jgi:murein DD-endopeptidase MepM/ murein hydrolase activator NlpD